METNNKEDIGNEWRRIEKGNCENNSIAKIAEFFKLITKFIIKNSDDLTHEQLEEILLKTDKYIAQVGANLNSKEEDLFYLLQISWYTVFLHDCKLVLYGLGEEDDLFCNIRPILEHALLSIKKPNFGQNVH
ncbi:MAG: hypothetical protein COB93_09530 [Sneathiella sp.]|nr:MAG: hypothetical protein COB93_09530 [Sneathiella sp.]